jgi:hypothetical protein
METDGEKNKIGPLETNIALCFARCLFFSFMDGCFAKRKKHSIDLW